MKGGTGFTRKNEPQNGTELHSYSTLPRLAAIVVRRHRRGGICAPVMSWNYVAGLPGRPGHARQVDSAIIHD
jgi:hypothetical protein